jgi:superfamily II DNA/RNA helicase
MENHMSNKTFTQFKLQDEILQAIDLLHYKNPTQVQTMLIEAMRQRKDGGFRHSDL